VSLPLVEPLVCVEDGNPPGSKVRRLIYTEKVRRLIYKGQVRRPIYKGKPLISLTEDQLPTGLYFAHVTEVAPIHHIDTTFIGVHILNWVYGHPDRIQ
jgi:hypothetical protein